MLFFLIVIGIPLISQYVSSQMRKRFVQFSNQPVPWSGREIAEMMLADHGITNVRVISTAGQLTDHYDPLKDTVNLSQPVYEQRTLLRLPLRLMSVVTRFRTRRNTRC